MARQGVGDEDGVDDDLGVRDENRGLGVLGRPEAEDRGRMLERLREIREWRDPDPSTDEQRPRHVEAKAVPERAEDRDPVARLQLGNRLRSRADRVDEEAELTPGRGAEGERAGQQSAGRLEHEELARNARLDRAAPDSYERVCAD